MTPMLVEVWSDVVCPWCYIGKRRFERAVAQLEADGSFEVEIDVVYRPYQLDTRAALGSSTPVADAYARKFGGPEQAAAIIDHLTSVAAAEGLEFRLDRALRANTRDAHRLLELALEFGSPVMQAALEERLFRAYFINGEDVGDHATLIAAAADVGLSERAARRLLEGDTGLTELQTALAQAAAAGIAAVPTYVIDRRLSIPGAQDPEVFVQVIRRLAERSADRAS